MRRLLLTVVLAAPAVLTAVPAQACDFEHCPWGQVLCRYVIDCSDPVPIEEQCYDTGDMRFCV